MSALLHRRHGLRPALEAYCAPERIHKMMRRLFAVSLLMLSVVVAHAPEPSSGITGLFLITKYPSLTVRAGETTTVDLSLRNFKLPPQILTLSVPETAQGWKA